MSPNSFRPIALLDYNVQVLPFVTMIDIRQFDDNARDCARDYGVTTYSYATSRHLLALARQLFLPLLLVHALLRGGPLPCYKPCLALLRGPVLLICN